MHADFLLAESREQIHGNSEWNKQIREAICENFADAIRQLNAGDSNLCYTWPRLLVASAENDDFFRVLMPGIEKKLKNLPILRSERGDRVTPDRYMVYFPDKWRLGPDKKTPVPMSDGQPYLSAKYHTGCTKIISRLGVEEISATNFATDLKRFGTEIAQQETDWHIGMAEIINGDWYLKIWCDSVNMIPVKSRKDSETLWVSSNAEHIFITLGYEGGISTLPQGIGMLFIPDEAAENQQRRQFNTGYGAKDVAGEIGNIILRVQEAHAKFDPEKSEEWTTNNLVSHVRFFFKHQEVPAPLRIWVAVESGPPQLASETFAIPITFNQRPLQVPLLHPAYLADLAEDDKEKLVVWMTETFKMPNSPRLASSKGSALFLSPEMKFIAEEYDSIHFLTQLQYHHPFVTSQLQKDGEGFQEILWGKSHQ